MRLAQFRAGLPLPHHAVAQIAETPDFNASVSVPVAVGPAALIPFDTIAAGSEFLYGAGSFILPAAPGGLYMLHGAVTAQAPGDTISVQFFTSNDIGSFSIQAPAATTVPFSVNMKVPNGGPITAQLQCTAGVTVEGNVNGLPTTWMRCDQMLK